VCWQNIRRKFNEGRHAIDTQGLLGILICRQATLSEEADKQH
jgi:hypothetical protein